MQKVNNNLSIDRLFSSYILLSSIRLLLIDKIILPSEFIARLTPFGFSGNFIFIDFINYFSIGGLFFISSFYLYNNKPLKKVFLLYSFLIFINIFIDHYSFHHSTYFLAILCIAYFFDNRIKSSNYLFTKTIIIFTYIGAGYSKINESYLL